MWISHTCRDIKPEIRIILNRLLPNLNSVLINLLQQQRLQTRVKLLSNILNKDWLTKRDTCFKHSQEIIISEFEYHELRVLVFHFLDPFISLTLRVYHKGPSSGDGDHYSIVDGELVAWEAIDVP